MYSKPKLFIDVFMIAGILLSMGMHGLGPGIHKIAGLLTILLFIVHNILNRKWYRSLLSRNYRLPGAGQIFINLILITAMSVIMVSGVILSAEMAGTAENGMMTAGRLTHLISSYIGCGTIAVHIGLHLKRGKEDV